MIISNVPNFAHGTHYSDNNYWKTWPSQMRKWLTKWGTSAVNNTLGILFVAAVWETCTEYHCTPTKVFLSFSQSLRRPPTVAMWLKAQAIQLAQGPIKPTGSIYRAQLGVKRCSGICLLVGTSGKGLGCSLTLEPLGYEPNPNAALKPCRAATSLSVVDKNVKFKRLLVLKKNARKRQMKSWIGFWKRWTHLEKNMGKKQGQDHQTRPEDHWRERELEKGEWHWPVLGEVEP